MTIYYHCPFASKPVGGVKQIYRHVESLVAAGIDAQVLADRPLDPTWFESDAPLAVLRHRPAWQVRLAERLRRRIDSLAWLTGDTGPIVESVSAQGGTRRWRLGANDVIVLPEFYGKALRAPGFGARLVLFNQNAHYTYNGFGAEDSLAGFPYFGAASAVITVSHHNREYMQHAFPDARVYLTLNGVDTSVFKPLPKKRQIAYMPRKLPRDLVQVLQIVSGRGRLAGWTLCAIDGMHETQVTRVLGESSVFLSSCEAEGFGLPPLEAAACGCAVVGYTGYAAQEFMSADLCDPVTQGDVLGFARTLEAVLARFEDDAAAAEARAMRHADFVRQHYSRPSEAHSVVQTWQSILALHGARA